MKQRIKNLIIAPIILTIIITVVFVFDFLIPIDFNRFGIRPRSLFGLTGIPISPFLHADLNHLFSNIPTLLVLGVLICTFGQRFFIQITLLLILLSGFLTWIISSAGIVVGASGLVFAYWAYLITIGIRLKTMQTVVLAMITLLFYGGLFFGLASFNSQISWAGHFSGVVAGVLLAFLKPPNYNQQS